MGKFILCSGMRAKKPYCIKLSDFSLYTIEELCYYLYHNIHVVTNDFFTEELIDWLEYEVKMKELADKIRLFVKQNESVKDIVVAILCSTDYYSEQEIKDLIQVMIKLEGLPVIKRMKMKADQCASYRKYSLAAKLYEEILSNKDATLFTCEEYGDLLHNYGTVLMHLSALKEATAKFCEAYQRNKRKETFRQYLLTLRLCGMKDEYEKELKEFNFSLEEIENIDATCKEWKEKAKNQPDYQNILKLQKLKDDSDMVKFYQEADKLLEKWKAAYRKEIS